MNVLVKYFERPTNQRVTLVQLLCGENGLVESLEYLFQYGFRSQKLFKKLFIWDFIEKVCQELENLENSHLVIEKKIDKFINLVKLINKKRPNFGKDGKFQIFICLSCKESLLVEIFLLLSKTNTTYQLYEDNSFFKNFDLLKFTIEILKLTKQFDFKLENSILNGLSL
jgi:DENN domain-containing protein 5